jgi:hypothetical protein
VLQRLRCSSREVEFYLHILRIYAFEDRYRCQVQPPTSPRTSSPIPPAASIFFVHRCGVGVRKSRAEEEDDTGVESEYALKEAQATEFDALQLRVHDR